ncbi:MAG: hypothetical protein Q9170_007384, partial [Blastenia crenularia]
MIESPDKTAYESDCEDEYDGGVPLIEHDARSIALDVQDHLPEGLPEQIERRNLPADSQGSDGLESLELPDSQPGHVLGVGNNLPSDEAIMATDLVEQSVDHDASTEDWSSVVAEVPELAVDNHSSLFLPEPSQASGQVQHTVSNHSLAHLDIAIPDVEAEHEAAISEHTASSNVPLEILDWDDSEHIANGNVPLESFDWGDLEAEEDLEVDQEAELEQLYPPPFAWPSSFGVPEMKNMSFVRCLRFWRDVHALQRDIFSAQFPLLTEKDISRGIAKLEKRCVTRSEVEQGRCDVQGIDWDVFGVSRHAARRVRLLTYFNQANINTSYPIAKVVNHWPLFCSALYMNIEARQRASKIPDSEKYFQFSRMNLEHKLSLPHFQLRHTLSASSKNAIFFPTVTKDEYGIDRTGSNITCFNPSIDNDTNIINTASCDQHSDATRLQNIYTLTAKNGLLIAGGLQGEYAMKSLSSTPRSPFVSGMVTHGPNISINHVHTFVDRRSGLPQAVFASNDFHTHTLDCTTNKFISRHNHVKEVNCVATSPGIPLQVLVRDAKHPLLVEADSGKRIGKLSGHLDFGFACDWSEDGIHFATGAQDGLVNIYDARKWRKPIRTLTADLGGVRSLAFSPLGSGKPVLVMAESADFVHVVDAVNANADEDEENVGFDKKQTINFFGEVAG